MKVLYHIYEFKGFRLLLTADNEGLSGCGFPSPDPGQKGKLAILENAEEGCNEHIEEAVKWLDAYFSGEVPKNHIRFHFSGTEFQNMVWKELQKIPYGEWVSYGDIAKNIAKMKGIKRMSAQAVGGAVGKNPIGIINPCHRVLGADGSLTGFGGGLDMKRMLLDIEKIPYKENKNG